MLGCMAMFQVHSNRGLHAQKRRNSARKRRKEQVLKNSASGWRPSHPVTCWPSPFNSTWPSPASQTVSTSWRADRHTLWCLSRVRENQSPLPKTVFPMFLSHSLHLQCTRPERVVKDACPINRSKEEKERVEEFEQSISYTESICVICILVFIWFKSVTKKPCSVAILIQYSLPFNFNCFLFTGFLNSVASIFALLRGCWLGKN